MADGVRSRETYKVGGRRMPRSTDLGRYSSLGIVKAPGKCSCRASQPRTSKIGCASHFFQSIAMPAPTILRACDIAATAPLATAPL